MAVEKIRLGTNEDGTPHFLYRSTDGKPLVYTGPITGPVELADGTVVDVSDEIVEVEDDAQALAVSDAIGARYDAEGHPLFLADPTVPDLGFISVPSQEG